METLIYLLALGIAFVAGLTVSSHIECKGDVHNRLMRSSARLEELKHYNHRTKI